MIDLQATTNSNGCKRDKHTDFRNSSTSFIFSVYAIPFFNICTSAAIKKKYMKLLKIPINHLFIYSNFAFSGNN